MIVIILMRKKDVQPFLTTEDFWGAILIGFLAGYTGQELFQQLGSFLTHSATPRLNQTGTMGFPATTKEDFIPK